MLGGIRVCLGRWRGNLHVERALETPFPYVLPTFTRTTYCNEVVERSALKEHWKLKFRPIVREILLVGDVDHGGNHGAGGGGNYGESVLRFYCARREELYRAVRQRKFYRAGGSSSTGADFDPEMENLHVVAGGLENSTTTSEEPPRPRKQDLSSQPQHDAPSPRPVASEAVTSPPDKPTNHEDYTMRRIRMMKQAAASCVVPFDCSKGGRGAASCASLLPLVVAEGFPTAYWEGFTEDRKPEGGARSNDSRRRLVNMPQEQFMEEIGRRTNALLKSLELEKGRDVMEDAVGGCARNVMEDAVGGRGDWSLRTCEISPLPSFTNGDLRQWSQRRPSPMDPLAKVSVGEAGQSSTANVGLV